MAELLIFSLSNNHHIQQELATACHDYVHITPHFFEEENQLFAQLHRFPDLIFIDSNVLTSPILEVFEKIEILHPSGKQVFLIEHMALAEIVQFIKKGIYDCVNRQLPKLKDALSNVINNYLKEQELVDHQQKDSLIEKFKNLGFVGNSRSMRRVYRRIEKAAKSSISVLISGEIGTGKMLVAKTIHQLSTRHEGALRQLDVLAIPVDLREATLFGKEKDVFAGQLKRQIGEIEQASGGTLIISNIDQLSIPLQSKLLKALKERKFIRPGGSNIVFFNARMIVLGSRELKKLIKTGKFREDLYYQLARFSISLPALRKRGQDILLLANHFLRTFVRKNQLKSLIFAQSAKDLLLQQLYSGNIPELRTIVEASALMTESPSEISKENIIFTEEQPIHNWLDQELTLEEYNLKIIQYYLDHNNQNVVLVAQKLGIGKSTIYRLLKKHASNE